MTRQKEITPAFASALSSVAASGRAARGVSRLCRPEYWRQAADEFAGLKKIAIISGFFVPAAGAPETDGPGGAVMLARAFAEQKVEAEIWTDDFCIDVMRVCAEAAGFPADSVKTPEISKALDSYKPDGVIFTERLGRAADGKYYNIAMRDITRWTTPLDELAIMCRAAGVRTLGIGDGGNEVGMGVFYDKLSGMLPGYSNCLSVIRTDLVLPVDVSNWGAYAFIAALSLIWGEWRGHKKDEERAMLEAMRDFGAVDGISLRKELSVDGFPLEVNESVATDLFNLWYDNRR